MATERQRSFTGERAWSADRSRDQASERRYLENMQRAQPSAISAGISPRYTSRSVPLLMPEHKVRTRTSSAAGRGVGSSLISTQRGAV